MRRLPFSVMLCPLLLAAQDASLGNITVEASPQMLDDTTVTVTTELAETAQGETLGDYLQSEPFIDSASYGPAVGRPVVRGMDGYRVGISNGNIVLNDLSAMSQDHAVGVMARASERIETIKGPASLLYGAYSGGVIRVLSDEHTSDMKAGIAADAVAGYGAGGAGGVLGGAIRASDGTFSLYANTYFHDADPYRDGNGHEVRDSDTRALQSHVVFGYRISDDHGIKVYADSMQKGYGIPNTTDASTTIDMEQQRYGAVWHADDLYGAKLQTEIEYSDYLHDEREGGRADGLFGQTQLGASTMLHTDTDDGEIDLHLSYKNSDLQVCHEHGKCTRFFDAERTGAHQGEELAQNIATFGLPFAHGHPMPNINESLLQTGIAAKRYVGDADELHLSARAEYRMIDPDSRNIQEVWLVTPDIDPHYYDTLNDAAWSASAGWRTYLTPALSVQTSLGYVERLPSSTEIFWNGFHHATDTYIFGNRYIDNERSLNLDVDALLDQGAWSTRIGGFYYHFYNYIYQEPLRDTSGDLMTDPFHQSAVWAVRGKGARVFGGALKERYETASGGHALNAEAGVEAIRGVLLEGGNLPRIPTFNASLTLEHTYSDIHTNLSFRYVDESRFEAENETHTPGYGWLSARVSYEQKSRYGDYQLYLKGENLTDAMAYNHLSFLKTTAPLAGRQISVGVNASF